MRLRGYTRTVLPLLAAPIILLCIPAASATVHKVRQGDTLWDIAKKHNTTPKAIARANGIKEDAILKLDAAIRIPGRYAPGKQSRAARSRHYVKYDYAVHVKADSACLRKGPSTEHPKIAVLATGTTAKLLARKGGWAKIALPDGRCGFVFRPLMASGAGSSSMPADKSAARSEECAPEAADPGLVQTALVCKGDRYRRGGTSRGGFDCSGFTRYVFAKYGIRLPHSSAAQAKLGTPIAKSQLEPGDLVFFHTYRRGVSHVGIYIGNNRFVHASTYGRGVVVDSMSSSYYGGRYMGARRVR